MEIKQKVVLKEKGQSVNLPTVNQLMINLGWTSEVDLDLMAFYKKKDGSVGGVYSKELGGSHGDLNAFPFMQLSGDAGIGAQGGDNVETMKIMKMDDIETLQIVALNYTDAQAKNAAASFSAYNGKVTVTDEKGEAFEIPLESTDKGTAALLCTINNSGAIGATLKREDKVMAFEQFISEVQGADALTK